MHLRPSRVALIAVVALVVVALVAWAAGFSMPAASSALSRRELFLGMLTLGLLSVALFGIDLREWF